MIKNPNSNNSYNKSNSDNVVLSRRDDIDIALPKISTNLIVSVLFIKIKLSLYCAQSKQM